MKPLHLIPVDSAEARQILLDIARKHGRHTLPVTEQRKVHALLNRERREAARRHWQITATRNGWLPPTTDILEKA